MKKRRRKVLHLKALKYESNKESKFDDEGMVMMARRFRKFFKKNC